MKKNQKHIINFKGIESETFENKIRERMLKININPSNLTGYA